MLALTAVPVPHLRCISPKHMLRQRSECKECNWKVTPRSMDRGMEMRWVRKGGPVIV